MLLELKKVFLVENEALKAEYELDLHDMDFNGTKPLKTPIKVKANAVNRAGVVNLAVSAGFDYSAPCDRCGEETITSFCYSFNHTLVQSLAGENEGDGQQTEGCRCLPGEADHAAAHCPHRHGGGQCDQRGQRNL